MVAMFPTWTATLDAAIAAGGRIRVWCSTCRQNRDVDLVALRDRVGGAYSLRNRRCRCRLTPGCAGWNEFDYLNGVFRPLREIPVVEWRMHRDRSALAGSSRHKPVPLDQVQTAEDGCWPGAGT